MFRSRNVGGRGEVWTGPEGGKGGRSTGARCSCVQFNGAVAMCTTITHVDNRQLTRGKRSPNLFIYARLVRMPHVAGSERDTELEKKGKVEAIHRTTKTHRTMAL